MDFMKVRIATAVTALFLVSGAHAYFDAESLTEGDRKYLSIKEIKLVETTKDVFNQNTHKVLEQQTYNDTYKQYQQQDPWYPGGWGQDRGRFGRIVSIARDIVALGEDVYRLVIKGKPTITTTYAPVSVIPRQGEGAVDIFETENWKAPVKRSFKVVYTNYFGMDVVKYDFSVLYSYGGTHDGKGAYITAAQMQNDNVEVLFGYDFTASMKVGGIQNMATRENPVAGLTMILEYNVSTIVKTMTNTQTFFVLGTGKIKKL